MFKLAIIGCGLRAQTMLQAFQALNATIRVSAVADPQGEAIRRRNSDDPLFKGCHYYKDIETLLVGEDFDGAFLGTRCDLHSPLACRLLPLGLPLFLEKPVCISKTQYQELKSAGAGHENKVLVSFPLRRSPVVLEVKRLIDSGILGRITMVQAVNNVPYGSVYYHSWYREPQVTGGLFLQKATHDLDYIRFLTGEAPATVFAQCNRLHFWGDKAPDLRCPDCSEYRSCLESSYVVKQILKEDVQGEACCFCPKGNEDGACAIFSCASGLLISYNQSFVVKKSAARRGARLIGTKASIEFDFYSGEIRCDHYLKPQIDCSQLKTAHLPHFGGDERLALDFLALLDGQNSPSNLSDGLISAAACLAAKASAETRCPVTIDY